MSFLAPAFFIGLAAIAVPILIHLIQKERKEVVRFPSLMFIRKIPYQSVQRRKVHNWLLLLLRAAAILLLILAFSRPFSRPTDEGSVGERRARGRHPADHSASMGYGDHWGRRGRRRSRRRPRRRPRDACSSPRGGESFAPRRPRAARDGVAGGESQFGWHPHGPAAHAQSVLSRSSLPRKEAFLISDFQKIGWSSARRSIFLRAAR
jgi:hypothetical protein